MNSFIFVVICVRAFIEIIPSVKQIKLEMKARVNQNSNVVRNSVAIAKIYTLNYVSVFGKNLRLLAMYSKLTWALEGDGFCRKMRSLNLKKLVS